MGNRGGGTLSSLALSPVVDRDRIEALELVGG